MSGPELRPLDAKTVERAKRLLADIDGMDYADERAPYVLLGRALVVIDSLVEIVEGGGCDG